MMKLYFEVNEDSKRPVLPSTKWFDISRTFKTLKSKYNHNSHKEVMNVFRVIMDCNRVFLLFCCSALNSCLINNNAKGRELMIKYSLELISVTTLNTIEP